MTFVAKNRDVAFFEKVDKTPTCWIWTGATARDGYGTFWDGQRKAVAHRWAYERLVGPIPPGLHVDHLCRNPACVNPAHLEPVTNRENVLRGTSPNAINARKTHCNRGHPFDEANTYRDKYGRHCRACANRGKAQRRKVKEKEESFQW